MTNDELEWNEDSARLRALEAVEQGQRERAGKAVPVLAIIDRLTANANRASLADATNFWSVMLMELATDGYGYLEMVQPTAYMLTKKGWVEGMHRDSAAYPWGS